jgi:hypothetical protein
VDRWRDRENCEERDRDTDILRYKETELTIKILSKLPGTSTSCVSKKQDPKIVNC